MLRNEIIHMATSSALAQQHIYYIGHIPNVEKWVEAINKKAKTNRDVISVRWSCFTHNAEYYSYLIRTCMIYNGDNYGTQLNSNWISVPITYDSLKKALYIISDKMDVLYDTGNHANISLVISEVIKSHVSPSVSPLKIGSGNFIVMSQGAAESRVDIMQELFI